MSQSSRAEKSSHFNPLPPHGGRPVFPDRIINHFHFNPLPPHGGRRLHKRTVRGILSISIHSLRMEGDSNLTLIFQFLVLFQSTPSAWRETDVPELVELPHPAFQSTPSAWRETTKTSNKPCRYEFQSTPSAWRETRRLFICRSVENISIHSLRMEGDHEPA